ncbi:hypothetical protein PIB30_000587 [Stylosanthes scabra]|uniref:DUF4283 domain-containing protein n=1 Tax=Stylosanthes scabra TaxID=79078 RepID=A0ABU6X1S7_9FABA|nr:hypothetical protein [Stylosanthes scabra]
MSRFKRSQKGWNPASNGRRSHRGEHEDYKCLTGKGRIIKKWVPTGRLIEWRDNEGRKLHNTKGKNKVVRAEKPRRKEVVLSRSKFQSEILARSVLGVNVKPIDFGFLENTLLRKWTGPGIIECCDVGPFRCLITFEMEKIKEETIEDQLLASVFDEVRHHWDVVWSLSRRVWIEVMELKSHGHTARFLIDNYEWEAIHEWITVKVDDKEFEVFVKEFGGEVYSRESHPNDAELAYIGMGDEAIETESKNVALVPVFEDRAEINENNEFNDAIDEAVEIAGDTMHDDEGEGGRQNDREGKHVLTVCENGEDGIAPMVIGAQNSKPCSPIMGPQGVEEVEGRDGLLKDANPNPISSDTGSCPFPPGFGPCTNSNHVHRLHGPNGEADREPEECVNTKEMGECERQTLTEARREMRKIVNQ